MSRHFHKSRGLVKKCNNIKKIYTGHAVQASELCFTGKRDKQKLESRVQSSMGVGGRLKEGFGYQSLHIK